MGADRETTREELLKQVSVLNRRIAELEELHRKEAAERRRSDKALLFDQVTGLPSRILFFNHLKQTLPLMRRKNRGAAVLFFGVDRFKLINDTLGTEIGDLLLKQVGRRLQKAVRMSDIVARPGRDEFMILMADLATPEEASVRARGVLDAFRKPFRLKRHELLVSGSIGISLFPSDGASPETLIKNSYTALIGAREARASEYRFFSPQLNSRAFDRMLLENSLRVALERDQFSLHYQPQIHLATARATGIEALLRWQHPSLGHVSPTVFIPMVEDTGLITPLTEWVLDTACRHSVSLREKGLRPLRTAINLSPRQLREKNLVKTVRKTIDRTGVDPRLVEVELTEGALVHNVEETSATLTELSEMGVHISVDDFGTGYSSLSYLRHFPINRLKIDRSFIEAITTDHNNAAISRAIIALAHSLRLRVVAEGVERAEQLELLHALRCDEVQGFLFSPAVPPENLLPLLREKEAAGAWHRLDPSSHASDTPHFTDPAAFASLSHADL